MLTLLIGGARSGKSRFAQTLPEPSQRVAYVATCRPEDDEMNARVARHRKHRPAHWTTIEEPLEIARAVECIAGEFEFVILDCLTLWLSNIFWERRDSSDETIEAAVTDEIARLIKAAGRTHLIVVTNELGCSLVPETPVGRRFRDIHGWMNQDVAKSAGRVFGLVAGIPVAVKQEASK